MKKSLLTRLKTFMLLSSVPSLFLFVPNACQQWQPGITEENELEKRSKLPQKPVIVLKFTIWIQYNRDYSLLGDNTLPERRKPLNLTSWWRRQIFPIPR